MMNNNKILTVSYGTFSCTLEGFDDSFGTMKAIAEYFRDLASDDRYFGAEPPQPDAEMLARIAQKEVSRRVQAHERDGKIVLSAFEDGAAPEAAALAAPAAPQDAAAQVPDTVDLPDQDTVDLPVEAPAPQEAASAADVAGPQADEAPADPAASPASVQAIAETVAEVDSDESDVDTADAVVADADTADADLIEDENDIVPGQRDADVEAFFDRAEQDGIEIAQDTEEEQAPAQDAPVTGKAPAAESIAAKLQRIRAVVAQHDDEDEDDDYSEDEHADAADRTGKAEDVVADARRDIEDALEADQTADQQAAVDENADDAEVDEIADILRRLEGADTPADPLDDPEIAPVDMAAARTVVDAPEDDGIALQNVFEDDTVAAPELSEAPAKADQTPAPETATPNVVASKGLRIETAEAEQAPGAPKGPRARVIKVKRADLEAAIESGALEEYDDEDEETGQRAPTQMSLDDLAPARTPDTSLSAEEEDELARELAALQADMTDDHDDAQDATIAATLAELEKTAPAAEEEAEPKRVRARLPDIDENQDTDVSRLLAEADSQMGEPEGAGRRDAFSHLRAAVAAKKADQALGATDKTQGDDAYRNDLADVVRPRRPVSGEARTKRPGEGRPAPLKLVAEQRIDVTDAAKPAGPVSPRRVAKAAEASETGEGSFVDFANEMGATKLPDLLEAAAAYMSFVEGRENFSRPQLMSKVRQAGPDGFNREDTLRSFGKLLREGKIEKIKAGQFSASEDIGFRPGRRAAG